MHSLLHIALFVGLLSPLTSAAPTNIQKRSFKVERVRNAAFKGHDGPRQYYKALRKYNMGMPPGLLEWMNAEDLSEILGAGAGTDVGEGKKGDKKGKKPKKAGQGQGSNNGTSTGASNGTVSGIGLVTATPERGDVEYLSPIQIGGQTINVDFDSGSSDLWVFSSELPASQQGGHMLYDPSKSNTFAPIEGASFTISYGDGSGAAGIVGTDTVDIGGATVTEQAVELATAVSKSFVQDTHNNGLLGLAFSDINTVKPKKQKTFFDNIQPDLAEPVFTADLRRGAVGAYEFGRIDPAKFTGEMKFVPVNASQGFWQFTSNSFAVGTGQPQPGDSNNQAIADTGTTLILASTAVVNGYFSQVDSAQLNDTVGGVTIDCNAQLPDLMLDVGGVMATVKGSDINFAQIEGNNCFAGLQPVPDGVDLMIFGDIFFKSNFVAFHGGNNSLGVAQHA